MMEQARNVEVVGEVRGEVEEGIATHRPVLTANRLKGTREVKGMKKMTEPARNVRVVGEVGGRVEGGVEAGVAAHHPVPTVNRLKRTKELRGTEDREATEGILEKEAVVRIAAADLPNHPGPKVGQKEAKEGKAVEIKCHN